MAGPAQVTAFKASDGTLHESIAQAVAVDLMAIPGSGRGSPIHHTAAWAIIENRTYVMSLLNLLEPD